MVQLGTRDVEAYKPPEWLYNKVLFVEKKGLLPVLHVAKIAERFDMAIAAGEGYACRAAKDLLAAAERTGAVTALVLHDCDLDGFNISRTLRGATRTSRQTVKVLDLGLSLADALAAGLEPERVTRKKAMPAGLTAELTAEELDFLRGRRVAGSWEARWVELNAFTSGALVAFIECKLAQHGLTAKVLPPQEVVAAKAREAVAAEVEDAVTAEVARLLDLDALAARLSEQAVATMDMAALHASVRDGLQDNPPEPWDAIASEQAVAAVDFSGVGAAVREALGTSAIG